MKRGGMMPRRRPSARVLLLALAASFTAFFMSCGLPNPYPYDYGTLKSSDSFHTNISNTASFEHSLNTLDLQKVGFNLYYYLADEADQTPSANNFTRLELPPSKSFVPTIEIPETSVNELSTVYADLSFEIGSEILTFSLFADAARKNQLVFYLNDAGTTSDSSVGITIVTENSQFLYIGFEYVIDSVYDVGEQPFHRLGYITLD
jgi:hypothetical protein